MRVTISSGIKSLSPKIRGFEKSSTPSLRSLRGGEGISFLPRRVGGKMVWYVGATSDSELLEAQDLVRAFIGQTYSSYGSSHRLPLDNSDSLDAACLSLAGRCFFKFEVWPTGDLNQQLRVYQQIKLLSALREQSPRHEGPEARPVWRVLLDFELALTHGDRDAAESLFAELVNDAALPSRTCPSSRYGSLRLSKNGIGFSRWRRSERCFGYRDRSACQGPSWRPSFKPG